MARANTPIAAVPTLGATTDQASRGGFFTQSNVDVVGRLEDSVVVNDSQITISINGEEQSFTLNQAMAETLQFTVEGGGGGTSDGNTFINAGRTEGDMLILTYNDDDEEALRIQLPEDDDTTYTFSTDGNGILTITPSEGNPQTIDITENSGGGTGTVTGGTDSVVIDGATLTVVIDAMGVPTLTYSAAPPAPLPPSVIIPDDVEDSVFAPAEDETFDFTVNPGTGGGGVANGGDVSPEVTRTNPDGTTTMITVNTPEVTDGTDIVVTIPAADAAPEGDYEVRITPTITRPDGTTDVIRNLDPAVYERFVPFFQYRTQPTSATEVTGGAASDAVWANAVEAIDGSGSLFIAVEDGLLATTVTQARLNDRLNGFRVRVGVVGSPITVTDSGGQDIVYNIFRTAGVEAGNTLFF